MTNQPSSGNTETIIPLYEENVSIQRRTAARDVRVATRTTTHDQEIDELLARETVEIERVPIGRPVDVAPPIREEGDTTVIAVVEEVLLSNGGW